MPKETVTAVYEKGMLRLLEPLPLPDHTRVQLTIEDTKPPDEDGDPVLDLIGAYRSDRPLIDDIPVSEDPDLYLLAEAMGEEAAGMHAWEIAPNRYRRSESGRPVRIMDEE